MIALHFPRPLIAGTLLRRYKRFLADVQLDDGRQIVAHSPNTGSMLGVSDPGSRIWLLHHDDPRRKTRYTWELTELPDGTRVGVNTARSNALVRAIIEAGALPALTGYARMDGEVRYGTESSRIDLLLKGHPTQPDAFIEVKNVTAADSQGAALFPDAVTQRGQKHMRELIRMKAAGYRALVVFTVQRNDCTCARPAWEIDPDYARLLKQAAEAGVEILPLQFEPTPEAIRFTGLLPWRWNVP